MIEHPLWSPAELHQMRVMRDRLARGRGHVQLSQKPNQAEQYVIDEWHREHFKPEKPEGLIHWPFGLASKLYLGLLLSILALTIWAGMNGALPEATPEQKRPYYDRYLEPIFGPSPWERARQAEEVEARRVQYAQDRAAGVPIAPLAVPPVEPRAPAQTPTAN